MWTQRAHSSLLNQQLDLPLLALAPFPPPLSPTPAPIHPQQLWTSLSATMQAQARQTIVRILQEVFHDEPSL
jgi:hypothetical protein